MKKEECKEALDLLFNEANFEDWTKSVNAYHLLKALIDKHFYEGKKNKEIYNLKHLRMNAKIELSYYGQEIELDIYDIETQQVIKSFKTKKKQGFDNLIFEEIFYWLEERISEK